MGVTFYICDTSRMDTLNKLVDEMEEEDPLEEVEDSAYDRFAAELEAHHLEAIPLSEDASAPAEVFYEWFHDRVSHDLDKLYLTAEEARDALGAFERLSRKKGFDALVDELWSPAEEFSRETAHAYLIQVREALQKAVQADGLMVICYR
jgi:hypothetical protein